MRNNIPRRLITDTGKKEPGQDPFLPSEGEIVAYLNNYMRTIAGPAIFGEFFIKKLDETRELSSGDLDIFIETLEASEPAIYFPPSVHINENALFDTYQTTGAAVGSSVVASGLSASILKRRTSTLVDTIDVYLHLSNPYGTINISYQVWRLAGVESTPEEIS